MWYVKTNKILLLLVLTVYSGGAYAQHFDLCGVSAQRHEITRRFDEKPDKEAWKIIAPYKEQVDSLIGPVLGVSAQEMCKKRPESLLSNLVADALLAESGQLGRLADMALCNMGGLRSSLPKGVVTWGDVLEISPFENKFCVLVLQGDALLELLEQIAAVGGEGVSRVKMEISADNKLIKATLAGNTIVSDSLYTIATLDYLAEGNDNMQALTKAVKVDVMSITVRDVLANYIRKFTKQGKKITSKIEGRISVKK